jgi:hypothetical protein
MRVYKHIYGSSPYYCSVRYRENAGTYASKKSKVIYLHAFTNIPASVSNEIRYWENSFSRLWIVDIHFKMIVHAKFDSQPRVVGCLDLTGNFDSI